MSSHSPWSKTKIVNSQYLDILKIRPVPAGLNDKKYKIQHQYEQRPDLLAYDLYKDHRLWWIFAQRNMDIIQDPIYDFKEGVEIYLPDAVNVKKILG